MKSRAQEIEQFSEPEVREDQSSLSSDDPDERHCNGGSDDNPDDCQELTIIKETMKLFASPEREDIQDLENKEKKAAE